MAIRHRASPEIREFLAYWLLEQVAARGLAPGRLRAEVVSQSDGDLRPADSDIQAAQITCWKRGWLDTGHPFAVQPARLSPRGRAELDRRTATLRSRRRGDDPREMAADCLLRLLSPPDEHEVLDVGTGDGFLAKKLAAAGFRVLGIDIDADAIAGAAAACPPGGRLRFEAADIHALAHREQRWSRIVTSYLLHECDEPIATLRSICGCLQPGGELACMDFAPNCSAYLSGAGRTPFHPFRGLAEGDWEALAPEFGLTLIEYLGFGPVSVALARSQVAGDGDTEMTRLRGGRSS
jgi:2-polyprenyl-3-methyl-5-hydroxy-6-metoxy-1,4-benzoquinol methylase